MRMLVVEDEVFSRRKLTRDLEKLGFEVEAAENGSVAWEKYQHEGFQLVVTDWNMPEMTGVELIHRIRNMEREEYVYLILLTGRTDKEDLVEGMEAGADDFIAKPFELEELRVRLRAGERMIQIQQTLTQQKKELEAWKAKAEKRTEELDRSNAELDQFAYAAWHDLRAPLRTIQTRTERLEQRWKSQFDTKAVEDITRVLNNVKGIYEIIDKLYEHSQVGGLDGETVPTNFSLAFEKAVANLQAEITECHAKVTANVLPTVTVVEAEIIRLFQNLIGNAIKYRGTEPPNVHVGACREGSHWLFSVKDNGIGFAPDKKDKIFEAGIKSRLHGTKEYPGTGFGLAFCKKVVERHGGRIWAESEEEKGSTFFFTLPAEEHRE